MKNCQNIYDNSVFFEEYNNMREKKINANELIEIPAIKTLLPDLSGMTILDLGCGAGGMSRYFIEKGAKKVVALDVSENMINLAKSQSGDMNIEYLKMPMEEISSINEKFDMVFSSLAFHYIEDFNKLIKDISNLLKPNGILLYSQEHPIVTAPILGEGVNKYTEIDGKRYYFFSDYNKCGKRSIFWNVDGVIKYHRNFSEITKALIDNNLQLLVLEESKASEEAIKLVPKYIYQLDRPFFLYIKARKL